MQETLDSETVPGCGAWLFYNERGESFIRAKSACVAEGTVSLQGCIVRCVSVFYAPSSFIPFQSDDLRHGCQRRASTQHMGRSRWVLPWVIFFLPFAMALEVEVIESCRVHFDVRPRSHLEAVRAKVLCRSVNNDTSRGAH